MADAGTDVVIVGGGPAGSTAAAVLAMHGRRVLVLEREKFPRYCVGESLMPYCYFPLERIGLVERMKASRFQRKYSVQFINVDGKASQPFYFDRHFQHPASMTWQVMRGEFDQMLLENAREKGAEVREETRVLEFLRDGGRVTGVKAQPKEGEPCEVRAKVTIDATGRDALSMHRNKWRVSDPHLRKIALWSYYRGAKRDPGRDEGATTVAFLPEKGWFWYIPLPDDIVSVGIVAEKDVLFRETRDREAIFDAEVKRNAWIEDHVAPGKRIPIPDGGTERFTMASEWSYRSRKWAEDGLVLAGDAMGFLDPVFSSGVFIALKSGELCGDAVHAALEAGDVSASRFEAYGKEVHRGLDVMRRLVYAFYDNEFSMRKFVMAHPDLKGDVTDCLIGNLFRDFTNLFEAIGKFAELPEPAA